MTCLENNLHTVSYYLTWAYLLTCFSCDVQIPLPSNYCNLEKYWKSTNICNHICRFENLWFILPFFEVPFAFRKHLLNIFMYEPYSTYMSVCVGRWILWRQLHVALKLQKVRKDIENFNNENFWMKGLENSVSFYMVKPS